MIKRVYNIADKVFACPSSDKFRSLGRKLWRNIGKRCPTKAQRHIQARFVFAFLRPREWKMAPARKGCTEVLLRKRIETAREPMSQQDRYFVCLKMSTSRKEKKIPFVFTRSKSVVSFSGASRLGDFGASQSSSFFTSESIIEQWSAKKDLIISVCFESKSEAISSFLPFAPSVTLLIAIVPLLQEFAVLGIFENEREFSDFPDPEAPFFARSWKEKDPPPPREGLINRPVSFIESSALSFTGATLAPGRIAILGVRS